MAMRAAVMRDKKIVADTVPDPEPGPGQVLVRTLACGICGSDLHALQHGEQMAAATREAGGDQAADFDPTRDMVMGHEFCAEIVDFGPSTLRHRKVGERVCSMPVLFHSAGVSGIGYSNRFPGGYGELMVLSEPMLIPVPNGLATEQAALTEPMAVGIHAVAKASPGSQDAVLVVGCGPVGLAVIAGLELAGIGPVVASDFSPKRRALAETMGADVVVDPGAEDVPAVFARVAGSKQAIVFECVGVPGVIDQVMRDAPRGARIVVAGVCMEPDRIRPMFGIHKELSIQFVLGYTPEEFAQSLEALAEGAIPGEPLITGKVDIDGVAGAFETLADPEAHAKILVEP
jgi:2-desacetyl-2-hydroxyethyl bacteriochlorophyllide A dehydrogenase